MENHYQYALVGYKLDAIDWRRMASLQVFLRIRSKLWILI